MVNRIWPTAVPGKADKELTVTALACHIGGPNSVNPGQILLVYGNYLADKNPLKIPFQFTNIFKEENIFEIHF